ncbi:uncharacterized protein LOC144581491 [Callithrix jacchus]
MFHWVLKSDGLSLSSSSLHGCLDVDVIVGKQASVIQMQKPNPYLTDFLLFYDIILQKMGHKEEHDKGYCCAQVLIDDTLRDMDESGEHHSQQTDTRTENEIPHILTHRRVMKNENTWTQKGEY